MKKIIVIGMALVILCTCVACGVKNTSAANIDYIEAAVDATLKYVDETYDEGCNSEAYELNDHTYSVWQALFDEDISDCIAVVVVRDVNDDIVDLFAVRI